MKPTPLNPDIEWKTQIQVTDTWDPTECYCAIYPKPPCLPRGPVPSLSDNLYRLGSCPPILQCSLEDKAGIALLQCPLNVQENFLLGEAMFKSM